MLAHVAASVAYRLRRPAQPIRKRLANPAAERALLRFTRGRPFESPLRELLVPPNDAYPPGSIRQVTRNGVRLHLDIHDWNDFSIYWGWRNDIYKTIVACTPPGGTVIDVGANNGYTALLEARRAGRVVALEPNPATFASLQRNVALNPNLNVETLHAAAGSTIGFVYLRPGPPHQSGTTMVFASPGANLLPAPVITIDALCEECLLTPDLVKIDAEGFEREILLGAYETISRCHPVLIVECVDQVLREHGTSHGELKAMLRDFGYALYPLQGRQLDEDDLDILGVPRSR